MKKVQHHKASNHPSDQQKVAQQSSSPKKTFPKKKREPSPPKASDKQKKTKADGDVKDGHIVKKVMKQEDRSTNQVKKPPINPAKKVYYATGRRKTSSARVFLKTGSGKISINGKSPSQYLKRLASRFLAKQPLAISKMKNKVDLKITVKGGGESGQAGAIRHGIARVLVNFDPDLRPLLKKEGFLSRDSRMVERKKYGLRGARKRFQYSKR